jgi:hypothetical protein
MIVGMSLGALGPLAGALYAQSASFAGAMAQVGRMTYLFNAIMNAQIQTSITMATTNSVMGKAA